MLRFFMLVILFQSTSAFAGKKPLALVWRGPGACKVFCYPAAAHMARKAGYRVKDIYPHTKDLSVFEQADIWVQPGGKSVRAVGSMRPELIQKIRDFVYQGGGYVGFCAGMFASTESIGTSGKPGLGIVPGRTKLWSDITHQMPYIRAEDQNQKGRYMLFAGGPFIDLTEDEIIQNKVTIMGRYPDGKIASIRSHYGAGKVAVIGPHPEAYGLWKFADGQRDPDGNDYGYVMDMFRFAQAVPAK